MKTYLIIITALVLLTLTGCRENDLITETEIEEVIDLDEYPDWNSDTHGNETDPNFSVVFKQDEVLRFDIEITSNDWTYMQNNLASILSSGGRRPGMGGATVSSDPEWVKCSLKFDGVEWYNVGIRYKGNSSLRSAYQSGNNKLSFKLDFDEFEDDYPSLKNQRFYGFKQLNLNNNFEDASLMREKVGADLFRQFGLAAANTAFCEVYVDYGSGPVFFGVYTLVEEVDDTVIKTQFINETGNLYKPDGEAASFALGTFNTSEMEIKTNEETADYVDVKALYDAVNSSIRTTDIDVWKTELESILDVDGFIKWLAANTIIQNWDTYGRMTHNYYLYNNPENNLLTWVPWDNNEAFKEGKQGGALSISLSEVNSDWPLITYLIKDSEYKEKYKLYLQKFIDEVFVPNQLVETYSGYYELLRDYAYAEQTGYTFIRSNSEFDQAVEELKTHVQERNNAVKSYLQ